MFILGYSHHIGRSEILVTRNHNTTGLSVLPEPNCVIFQRLFCKYHSFRYLKEYHQYQDGLINKDQFRTDGFLFNFGEKLHSPF